jgi:hypothetical protein
MDMTKPKDERCPFNEGVVCPVQLFCEKCGWNPEVAKERKNRILQELKKRGGKNGRNHES